MTNTKTFERVFKESYLDAKNDYTSTLDKSKRQRDYVMNKLKTSKIEATEGRAKVELELDKDTTTWAQGNSIAGLRGTLKIYIDNKKVLDTEAPVISVAGICTSLFKWFKEDEGLVGFIDTMVENDVTLSEVKDDLTDAFEEIINQCDRLSEKANGFYTALSNRNSTVSKKFDDYKNQAKIENPEEFKPNLEVGDEVRITTRRIGANKGTITSVDKKNKTVTVTTEYGDEVELSNREVVSAKVPEKDNITKWS